uniref:SFRICE_010508 n=1 Tax=Spodoptera frugiperda TaxID=7108 RepID=A0A2H1VT89_SPOFR
MFLATAAAARAAPPHVRRRAPAPPRPRLSPAPFLARTWPRTTAAIQTRRRSPQAGVAAPAVRRREQLLRLHIDLSTACVDSN